MSDHDKPTLHDIAAPEVQAFYASQGVTFTLEMILALCIVEEDDVQQAVAGTQQDSLQKEVLADYLREWVDMHLATSPGLYFEPETPLILRVDMDLIYWRNVAGSLISLLTVSREVRDSLREQAEKQLQ